MTQGSTVREVRTLVTGRGLIEAPRWHDGTVYFSDWDAGEVLALDPASGETWVHARVPSFPLCSTVGADGWLLVVDSPGRRVLRREPDGTLAPYADLSSVAVPMWNDVVADAAGNVYVNGADFETGASAVAHVGPDGTVHAVADGIRFPNGMAVTSDGGTLLVADSYGQEILGFTIGADGALSGRHTWAAVPEHPDGICVDAEGALWFADVGTGRCVRVAEGGEVLDEVVADRGCFACVLGGPLRSTLYITAARWLGWEQGVEPGTGTLLAVDVDVPGAGWP